MHQDDWSSQLFPRSPPEANHSALPQRLFRAARSAKRAVAYRLNLALLRRWDRHHRVDTGGWFRFHSAVDSTSHPKGGYDVVSTPPSVFRFVAKYFPPTLGTYTYVDIGAGKGRTVLLASEVGFKHAIGVELAEFACGIARKNLVSYRSTVSDRCTTEIVNADATRYELPKGNLMLFFNNPFGPDVWPDMVRNITTAFEKDRKIAIVLIGSFPDTIETAVELLEKTGIFRIKAQGITSRFLDSYARFHYFVLDDKVPGSQKPV